MPQNRQTSYFPKIIELFSNRFGNVSKCFWKMSNDFGLFFLTFVMFFFQKCWICFQNVWKFSKILEFWPASASRRTWLPGPGQSLALSRGRKQSRIIFTYSLLSNETKELQTNLVPGPGRAFSCLCVTFNRNNVVRPAELRPLETQTTTKA